MAKLADINEKIAETVADGYKKIEKTVVYLSHRKDDTRCTDKHQELRLKSRRDEMNNLKRRSEFKTSLTFGKNK